MGACCYAERSIKWANTCCARQQQNYRKYAENNSGYAGYQSGKIEDADCHCHDSPNYPVYYTHIFLHENHHLHPLANFCLPYQKNFAKYTAPVIAPMQTRHTSINFPIVFIFLLC
jgi:hypothetical protein